MDTSTKGAPYADTLIASIKDIGKGALAQAQAQNQDVSALAQLTSAAYAFCETVTRDLLDQDPPPQSIVCGPKCWHCCISPRVEALPIEVLVIASHIKATTVPPALAALMATHSGEGTPDFTGPGRICPLLVDSQCAIYPVRPFVCRSFNAYDRAACSAKKVEGKDVKILGYAHQGLTYQGALAGLEQACRAQGLSSTLVDLPSALALALDDVEGYVQRWLGGEEVFPAP